MYNSGKSVKINITPAVMSDLLMGNIHTWATKLECCPSEIYL